jgi:hypothetical protein
VWNYVLGWAQEKKPRNSKGNLRTNSCYSFIPPRYPALRAPPITRVKYQLIDIISSYVSTCNVFFIQSYQERERVVIFHTQAIRIPKKLSSSLPATSKIFDLSPPCGI